MSKPALVVLAAGMGSRYGGLKQMDSFGPNGENIIDYSIYDAIRAGFGSVVFIIREQFRAEFEEFFSGKFDDVLDVHFVSQELDKLPSGYTVPDGRVKPWGTAHAVLMAKDVVDVPFGVINADDFYGRDAFYTLANALKAMQSTGEYCVVGYYLKNTLSEHGTVNRGVCKADTNGYLIDVEEIRKIGREKDGTITYPGENGQGGTLAEDTLVSMNMWGFLPDYFDICERHFRQFLDDHAQTEGSEYYIPTLVDYLIEHNMKQVRVLSSTSHWFGVTYKEDKDAVMDKLNALIQSGEYPEKIWGT